MEFNNLAPLCYVMEKLVKKGSLVLEKKLKMLLSQETKNNELQDVTC